MEILIPEDKIAEIRNATDIVDVISEKIILSKKGKNYVGLCPFHAEKTPSFSVSPDKQMYYCFGCHAGGNVINFVMKHDALNFIEALKLLSRRQGIDIAPIRPSGAHGIKQSEKDILFQIMGKAALIFKKNLFESKPGETARHYLEKRGFSSDIIEKFQIGYAPKSWDFILSKFFKHKIPIQLVEKAGLIIPKKNGGYYDRFRDRIIFPIWDVNSRIIGFGGRVLDDSLPKYLNSPESPIYNKSRSLYGLNHAKHSCRESEKAFIVEGYFDLIAMHQKGFQNTVATLGTALTPQQIRMLKGYAKKMILLYDSDNAGIKAALRSIDLFNHENIDASICVLPEGYDPDKYLFENEKNSFETLADKAPSIILFLIDNAIKKHGKSLEGKINIINELKIPLASISNSFSRSLYIKELSEQISVDESIVLQKIKETISRQMGNETQELNSFHGPEGKNDYIKLVEDENKIERKIISMMLQFPDIVPEINKRNLIARFEDAKMKYIGGIIVKTRAKNISISDYLSREDSQDIANIIAKLSMEDSQWNYDGCMSLIKQFESRTSSREDMLIQQIKEAESKNDQERVLTLLKEKYALAQKKLTENHESAGGESL